MWKNYSRNSLGKLVSHFWQFMSSLFISGSYLKYSASRYQDNAISVLEIYNFLKPLLSMMKTDFPRDNTFVILMNEKYANV